MKIALCLNGTSNYNIIKKYDLIIAVDGGYNFLEKQNIIPHLLIGDLDSIKDNNTNIKTIKFPVKKDYTDFELSLKYIEENYDNYTIDVYNYKSLSRIEHFIANIKLIKDYITFIDEYSIITCITTTKKETFKVIKMHKYISLFAIKDVMNITTTNSKYNLENYNLNTNDILAISNEITKDYINITFDSGQLLIIQSKED